MKRPPWDALELMIEELRTIRRKATPAIRMNHSVDQGSNDRSETADTVRLFTNVWEPLCPQNFSSTDDGIFYAIPMQRQLRRNNLRDLRRFLLK